MIQLIRAPPTIAPQVRLEVERSKLFIFFNISMDGREDLGLKNTIIENRVE